ncbi:MAG: hypothetical protein FWG82_01545 [Oscillospiraceae bacterium]|nr:hypothetical protein [Oscillospiraceae bacterium]
MDVFKTVLKKYGRPTQLISETGFPIASYSAFIQPLRYKNKLYLYGTHTEIGYNSHGHYLYIGPPEYDLQTEGQEIKIGSDHYRIERAETVYLGAEPLYVWAVIRENVV